MSIEILIQDGINSLKKDKITTALLLAIEALSKRNLSVDEQLKLLEGIRDYFRIMEQPDYEAKYKLKKLEEQISKLNKINLEYLEEIKQVSNISDENKKYKLDLLEKDKELKRLISLVSNLEEQITYNNVINDEIIEKDNEILQKKQEIFQYQKLLNKFKFEYSKLRNDYEIKNKLLRDCEEKNIILNIPESIQKSNSIEIRSLENVVTLYDESLRYFEDGKYFKISIYIQDGNYKNIDKIEDLHKYHFYNCRTIQEMKTQQRSFRYCVSTRSDNFFKYKIYRNNKLEVYNDNHELYVCKNCLSIYNKQYININNVKIQEPIEFNQKKLLEQYIKSDLIELDNKELVLLSSEYVYDYEQIPNIYSEKWPTISQVVKDTNNHTCEECQWQPKSNEENKYLHVHHINFKKFDNKLTNLKVLCIDCHSKQPNHKHIQKSKDWKNFQKIK